MWYKISSLPYRANPESSPQLADESSPGTNGVEGGEVVKKSSWKEDKFSATDEEGNGDKYKKLTNLIKNFKNLNIFSIFRIFSVKHSTNWLAYRFCSWR